MLEAITAYYRVRKTPPVHERLHELILILGNTVIRNNVAACVDEYQRDWEPLQEAGLGRISYGHQLEIIWLLMDACDATGMPAGILLPLYRALFDYALQYGFDRSNGGFYHSGIINAAADRREKVWWVQAESLVCALRLHELTQEKPYLDCFRRILDWIVKHQADWEGGDWHEIVMEDFSIAGHKAYHWKSPYHNGRAMLLCLELLSRMTARQ
jgi:mannobiose 2-epimerase